MAKSPYIAHHNRLADVIAAIQAMAVHRWHMLSFDAWAEQIGADPLKGAYWKEIFEQHPEFFRLDSTRTLASLVWRRNLPKRFHVDKYELLSTTQYAALSDTEKGRVSRAPLLPADIKALIDAAINLHSRAVDIQREGRWWVPLVASAIGGLIGAFLGGALKK